MHSSLGHLSSLPAPFPNSPATPSLFAHPAAPRSYIRDRVQLWICQKCTSNILFTLFPEIPTSWSLPLAFYPCKAPHLYLFKASPLIQVILPAIALGPSLFNQWVPVLPTPPSSLYSRLLSSHLFFPNPSPTCSSSKLTFPLLHWLLLLHYPSFSHTVLAPCQSPHLPTSKPRLKFQAFYPKSTCQALCHTRVYLVPVPLHLN